MDNLQIAIRALLAKYTWRARVTLRGWLVGLKLATWQGKGGFALLVAVMTVLALSVYALLALAGGGRASGTNDLVTCTSVIKLVNKQFDKRLHSHDVKYGSGSGQQSVTGVASMLEANSYWIVLPPAGQQCVRGSEIACGSPIRLAHSKTGCLLHSHLFKSPLSGNQEVSCFGANQKGDSGDDWVVLCDGDFWTRNSDLRFRHNDTGSFLGMTGHKYMRPITGHHEVCAFKSSNAQNVWNVNEGVFMRKSTPLD